MITFIDSDDSYMWKGVVLSVLMFLFTLLHSLFVQSRVAYSFICGAQARTVVNAAVYRKVQILTDVTKQIYLVTNSWRAKREKIMH